MKKLVFLLVCFFTLQTVARADDDKPIQVTQMPQQAQQFIKQHFADSKVALAAAKSVARRASIMNSGAPGGCPTSSL